MSLEGMDVDQVQRLAQQLNGYAQALNHIASGFSSLTSELSYRWRGSASAAFQQQWSAHYQGSVSGAAHALTDMHAHLTANIQQQVQASGTDAGAAGTPGSGIRAAISGITLTALLGAARSAWGITKRADDYYSLATGPLELAHQLGDSARVQEAYSLLEKMPGHDLIDGASKGLGLAEGSLDAGKAAGAAYNHHYGAAASDTADAAASFLKASKDPVLILAGVDISLVKTDIDLGSKVDWSEGIPNPFDPGVFRDDYLPTFKQLPGQLISTLAGVF